MDTQAYLQRINYHDAATPTVTTLQSIHLTHLFSVPFENLDVVLKLTNCG
jgi:N-hydroxyarylamine O-acetyltransferase